jgi:hypothetical protein
MLYSAKKRFTNKNLPIKNLYLAENMALGGIHGDYDGMQCTREKIAFNVLIIYSIFLNLNIFE